MGVTSDINNCINLTVLSTYSPIWISELPELGTRQFTREFWGGLKTTVRWISLNNNQSIGTENWMNKIFHTNSFTIGSNNVVLKSYKILQQT